LADHRARDATRCRFPDLGPPRVICVIDAAIGITAGQSLVQSLIEKCEVALHKDANGWHLSAKGAFGVATLLIIVFVIARIL
jgi:hypothetical protein